MKNKDTIRHLVLSQISSIGLNEATLLYRLAKKVSGPVVEIGTRRGGTACILGLSDVKNSDRVYSIDIGPPARTGDPEYDQDKVKSLMKEYGVSCNIICEDSLEYVKRWDGGEISMVFVDGCHEAGHVKSDMTQWGALIKVGGYLCCHDFPSDWPRTQRRYKKLSRERRKLFHKWQVYRGATKFMKRHPQFKRVDHVGTVLVLQKMG